MGLPRGDWPKHDMRARYLSSFDSKYDMKLTPEKRTRFLEVLATTANVSRAAADIEMARTYMYEVRSEDPLFEKAWDKAVRLGTHALEDEAARRASEGWDEPVFYQGVQTGLVRKFSDTLLIFLLKARDPEKYSERLRQELTGKSGGPIETRNVDDLTDEQLTAIAIRGRPASAEPEAGQD